MGYELSDADAARDYWATRATQWDAWADHLAPLAERFNAALIEAIDLRPGQTVIDLASGAGEPALTLAKHVGASGSVTATDLVPEMLAGARRRVKSAGLSNVSFEICGMDDLPFKDSTFDAATCRFGLMFITDPVAALAAIRRVLKAGGRAACMVWGPQSANTLFQVLQSVVPPVLGEESDGAESPMFAFAARDSLKRAFAEAGFREAGEIELEFAPKIDTNEPFWQPFVEMSFGHTLTTISADTRGEIDEAVRTAFQESVVDGKYRLSVHARIGVGLVED